MKISKCLDVNRIHQNAAILPFLAEIGQCPIFKTADKTVGIGSRPERAQTGQGRKLLDVLRVQIGNLFVVWALTGFWHGANWTFPAWGLLYFCVLVLEKTTGFADKLGVLARPYTLIVVALAWTVFRADSIGTAVHYWAIMFGLTDVPMVDERFWGLLGACKIILPIAFVLSFPVWPRLKEQLAGNVLLESIIEPITIVCIFLLSVMQVVSASYNPFIYFNF